MTPEEKKTANKILIVETIIAIVIIALIFL